MCLEAAKKFTKLVCLMQGAADHELCLLWRMQPCRWTHIQSRGAIHTHQYVFEISRKMVSRLHHPKFFSETPTQRNTTFLFAN